MHENLIDVDNKPLGHPEEQPKHVLDRARAHTAAYKNSLPERNVPEPKPHAPANAVPAPAAPAPPTTPKDDEKAKEKK